jgi:deaminated glutathione amidase
MKIVLNVWAAGPAAWGADDTVPGSITGAHSHRCGGERVAFVYVRHNPLTERRAQMSITAAVIQLHASGDKRANLDRSERLIREAAMAGATLVALPEYFTCYGTAVSPESIAGRYGAAAESIPGPTTDRLCGLARELAITIHGGSLFERHQDAIHNTTTLIDSGGEVVAVYRKIHLFEARAPQITYSEGAAVQPGEEVVAAQLELDGQTVTAGLSICFDVRFPELYRILAAERGATLIFIPAAFPEATGRDHWELLVRARAVENQAYVLAPAQWGQQTDGSWLHGRSVIVDPWGTVLATVPDGEGFALASIDLHRVQSFRRDYPNLSSRQPQVYAAATERQYV